jgi:photosystem II stability/assembly factor-like uncharacterized protein
MSEVLWVGTRKGLFRLRSSGQDWRIDKVSFLASPVSMVLSDRRDGSVYAALNLGHFGVKLHRSDDGGENWTEVAVPAYPQSDAPDAPSLVQIWSLEAAGPNASDGLWAGTIPGGLFFSSDRGASWTMNAPLWERPERQQWFGGGADKPGIHSVCVDPRDPKHVLVGVSCGGVCRTRDGGQSWTSSATGMFAEYMPPEQQGNPDIQDPHRMVQCPAAPEALWVQHHNGVFRTTNCAETWTHVTGLKPSSFGFAVVVHPRDPDTAWFIPAVKDETRVPVDARLVVTRTRDGGQTSEVLVRGLPESASYDLVYRHALDIDATGDRLAFGSTTGHAWATTNGGDDWRRVDALLPPVYVVRF